MPKKLIVLIYFLFFFFNFTTSEADNKIKILNNINNLETLKFNFIQESFDKKEKGICYLKRPHFLECLYEDKKQKQLIINKRVLVIYHKRYNKIYRYPLSKSYFLDILNNKKFSEIIMKGEIQINSEFTEIEYLDDNKGKIIFSFDNKNYDLVGWKSIDANSNITVFKINNKLKNINIDKSYFIIPEGNY